MLKVHVFRFLSSLSRSLSMQFMGWERSFEKRVIAIRDKELKYQNLNYMIEVIFMNFILVLF